MKNRGLLFVVIVGALAVSQLTNQSFAQVRVDSPWVVQLKTKEDYKKYEPEVVEAAKWLEQTDLDKETDKRRQINTFVLQWLSGTPDVVIAIGEDLQKLLDDNAPLLTIYLASYARHIIENKGSFTKFTATKAGLTAVLNVYKKGIGIHKTRGLTQLAKMSESGLDNYITENMQ